MATSTARKTNTSTSKAPAAKAAPKAAPKAKKAPQTRTVPVEATTAPAPRVHAPITKADYPAPGDVLVLQETAPKGLGADQRKRWDYCVAAAEQATTDKVPFTAEYLAKHAPDGRRTLRRAVRAGLFTNWEYSKGGAPAADK